MYADNKYNIVLSIWTAVLKTLLITKLLKIKFSEETSEDGSDNTAKAAFISFGGSSAKDEEKESLIDEPIKSLQSKKESISQPIKLVHGEEEEKVSKTEVKKAPRRESKFKFSLKKKRRKTQLTRW